MRLKRWVLLPAGAFSIFMTADLAMAYVDMLDGGLTIVRVMSRVAFVLIENVVQASILFFRRQLKGPDMLIVVEPQSGVPVYRQLMDQIKFHIASGLLKPGDELPSTRALSAELGLNPMTISKAYSFLERDNVIERRPGLPLIVKSIGEDLLKDRKMSQLRENLQSTVTIVRQLGISNEQALEIFDEMLKKATEEPARDEEVTES